MYEEYLSTFSELMQLKYSFHQARKNIGEHEMLKAKGI
jgi:hypothetical protein